ncbi:MAG TPA: hypothetical protein VFA65_24195 [Bryobacteraceae bacterium]|nr:hypothetical protein [Bryobacteraceae bacterium]
MANSNAPFGFSQSSTLGGGTSNYRITNRLISSTNSTAIYYGDAVVPVTGSANGYITQATAGTVALAGIFYGCSYQSVATKQIIYSRWWPGTTDANGDITAFVCDDPFAKFLVQASSAGFPFADVGQNAQLAVGTGATNTGFSGMYINAVSTSNTYPFIITGVPNGPTDPVATSGYNWLEVAFNNMIYKTGITGIS